MVLAGRAVYQTAVNRRPVNLTLKRITSEDDGAGGTIDTETEIPATVRLSVPTKRDAVMKEAGMIVEKRITFMATWTEDVQTGDTFDYAGDHFKIVSVVPDTICGDVLGFQGEAEAIPQ